MKNFTETPKNESITIYFGERHYEDKRKLDTLTKSLRRSRTGTLDYLINYYQQNEKRIIQPVIF